MKRMDPSFREKALGFRSFSDFLRSRGDLVELDETSTTHLVRLRGEPNPGCAEAQALTLRRRLARGLTAGAGPRPTTSARNLPV